VDYELTKLGSTLWKAVEPLGAWAKDHVVEIHIARDRFDRKKKAGAQPRILPDRERPARSGS
jgi:hypothetical protein